MHVIFNIFLLIITFIMSSQHGCSNVSGDANKNVAGLVEGVIDVMCLINYARDTIDLTLSNWHALTEPKEDDSFLNFVA